MMRFLLRVILIVGLLASVALPAAAQVNCESRIEHMAAGQGALVSGDYATAIEHYTCVIDAGGRTSDAQVGRMLAQLLAGDLTSGFDQFALFNDTEALKAITDTYQAVDEIVEDEPTASAYAARGLILWLMGDDNADAVIDDLSEAISLGEATPTVYLVRSIMGLNLGSFEDSIADLEAALEQEPDDSNFYLLAGNIYAAVEDMDRAAASFERALELDPDQIDIYADLGDMYLNVNDYERAIQSFEKYLGLAPAGEVLLGAYFNLGFAHDKSGDALHAAEYYYRYLMETRTPFRERDELTANTVVTVEMTEGRVYQFPLDLAAGQLVDFSAKTAFASFVDPVIVVLAPDGTPITANDDLSEDIFDSEILAFEVPETGTYTVLVSHAFGGSEGNVEIEVGIAVMDI